MMASAATEAVGVSSAFLDLQERLARAARVSRPVILIGERGTGKELAAARLHRLSARWNKPYVTLNCAALAPTLIESELFGHEAGAFTGALRRRKGRFEQADGGSFFLDEIATIPIPAQEKVLRAVEYGEFERVGGSEPVRVDVRLIAATHTDLPAMARAGAFREDLLDRLSFEVVTLPPLRARREDIAPLAAHFARRMARELALEECPAFAPAAMAALMDHPWPGNVRELKNVVERMVYRTEGPVIEAIVFDPFESMPGAARGGASGGASGAAPGAGVGSIAPRAADPAVESRPPGPRGYPDGDPGRFANADAGRNAGKGSGGSTSDMAAHSAADLDALALPDAVRAYETRRLRSALEECRFNQRRAAERLGMTYHQFRALYRRLAADLAEGDN